MPKTHCFYSSAWATSELLCGMAGNAAQTLMKRCEAATKSILALQASLLRMHTRVRRLEKVLLRSHDRMRDLGDAVTSLSARLALAEQVIAKQAADSSSDDSSSDGGMSAAISVASSSMSDNERVDRVLRDIFSVV